MNFQNLNNGFKISFAAFMIVVLVAALAVNVMFPPKPAKAYATLIQQIIEYIMEIINWYQDYSEQTSQDDHLDDIQDIQDWFKDDTLDRRDERESWNETRNDDLNDLANQVIDDIKNNNGTGEPAFVSDWEDFLTNYVQGAYQSFVDNGLDQAQICDTFKSETQAELSSNNGTSGNAPPYLTQSQCPSGYDPNALLTGNDTNYWADWLSMLSPSGNPYGSYMISSDEKTLSEGLAYTDRYGQLIANEGFQGTEETPGIIQAYDLERVSMMDLDNLIQSTDLETYFSSVSDAFFQRILGGSGLVNAPTTTYTPGGQPPTYPPVVPPEDQTASYVASNIGAMSSFTDRLNLTIQDLTGMISHINDNISMLNYIATLETNCGLSNAAALAEAATDSAAVAAAQAKIGLANQAISQANALIPLMNAVTAAKASGDNAALIAAAAAFNTAHTALLATVNSITGGSATTINQMLTNLSSFNSSTLNSYATYVARLGSSGTPWYMDNYLYGWAARLGTFCQD
jgi:hypothetical protein